MTNRTGSSEMVCLFRRSAVSLSLTAIFFSSASGYAQERPAGPPAAVMVESIRIRQLPDQTQVVIGLSSAVEFTYDKLPKPERLQVDLWGARLGPQLGFGTMAVNDSRLSAIRTSETAIGIRILMDLKSVARYEIVTESNPTRIEVRVYPTPPTPQPVAEAARPVETETAERAERAIRVIEQLGGEGSTTVKVVPPVPPRAQPAESAPSGGPAEGKQ
jgi:hypothetical protein